jgi:hypothetical protein
VIYIVYVKARFSSAQKRNTALGRVTNYLAQPAIASDLFVPSQVAAYDAAYKGWPNALTAECRFRTQAARDDLWSDLDTFLGQPNAAPVESLGERWDQMLDAPDPDADTTRYNYVTAHWPLA